jgi:thioredoxin 1
MYQRKSVSSSFLSLSLPLFYTENMVVTPIDNYLHLKEIIEQDKLVAIDFSAIWCGPCRTISPKFEEFSNIYNKGADFFSVDIDQQPVSVQKSF